MSNLYGENVYSDEELINDARYYQLWYVLKGEQYSFEDYVPVDPAYTEARFDHLTDCAGVHGNNVQFLTCPALKEVKGTIYAMEAEELDFPELETFGKIVAPNAKVINIPKAKHGIVNDQYVGNVSDVLMNAQPYKREGELDFSPS